MTNDYFLDTSAITEQELVDIIMSENNPEITEEMCRQLYKLCVEYSHDGLFATDTKVTIIGSENKSMVEQWMNDVGYYDRTGINPEILLSTLNG